MTSFLVLCGTANRGACAPPYGAIVEEIVEPSKNHSNAGIRVGDILVGWERAASPPENPAPARGEVRSPSDLGEVEAEQGPRGAMRLRLRRGTERLSIVVGPGPWGLKTRPVFSPRELERYVAGADLFARGASVEAVDAWRDLAMDRSRAGDHETAAWLLGLASEQLGDANNLEAEDAIFALALSEAATSGHEALTARLWEARALTAGRGARYDMAVKAFQRAVEVRECLGAPLALARALSNLGDNWNDPSVQIDLLFRAVEIRERYAPNSVGLARTFRALGYQYHTRGDLEAAEVYLQRSVEMLDRLLPDSGFAVLSRHAFATVVASRGDYSLAGSLMREIIAIEEKQATEGNRWFARFLGDLALLEATTGNLASAEDLSRRALSIQEKHFAGTLECAPSYTQLGELAKTRGEPDAAAALHRRALAIYDSQAPDGVDYAKSLGNLAGVTRDLAEKGKLLHRVLALLEKRAPDSLAVVSALSDLGLSDKERGDLQKAGELFGSAVALAEKVAPRSAEYAGVAYYLADVRRSSGDLDGAAALLDRSLSVVQRFAPRSELHARVLHDLALLHRAEQPVASMDLLLRALDALEAQVGKLGGTHETRARFGSQFVDYYRDAVEWLVSLGRHEEAFHVLERSRAHTLLELLAERDLRLAEEVPVALSSERRRIDAEYERTQTALGALGQISDPAEMERLLGRLQRLREQRAELAERVRRTSPRLASLVYPKPLDLAGARRVLDPGTVLLTYSVGKSSSALFVVDQTGIEAHTLDIGDLSLRKAVEALRELSNNGLASASVERSRKLYETLVRPAQAAIARSKRILIVPDGPLHVLPFAALVRELRNGQPSYLIEWKPLHTVVSATVYAELKAARRESEAASFAPLVAAFGDPTYPKLTRLASLTLRSESPEAASETFGAPVALDSQVRAAVERGARFEPLPASRREVESVSSLFGSNARVYLGEDATEERAKSLGKEPKLIHFACHAVLNERFPLDSALALTIPEQPREGQENGLLQAWEIFESVRLDADLVTLSACESGLGKEMGGEGLVGLTRAFQYAGARSILASLWRVQDQASAELMTRFYGYLKAGRTKDEALRQAQVDLIHTNESGVGLSSPVHWAAWELLGDWK